jgi:hypothetical protein
MVNVEGEWKMMTEGVRIPEEELSRRLGNVRRKW